MSRTAQRAPARQTTERSVDRATQDIIRASIQAIDQEGDEFYIDPSVIPDGMSYEWKRHSVYGQEDKAHQVKLERTGFMPVPASRHPEIAGRGAEGYIEKGGLVLCERASAITDAVEDSLKARAKGQVRDQVKKLGVTEKGQLPRQKPITKRSYEPVDLADDDTGDGFE